MRRYYVYILTNQRNGTLYIGVTANIRRRIWEHKTKLNPKSFTAKHDLNKLVYYETYEVVSNALHREKRLKEWHRKWKVNLIENHNPYWNDL